MLVGENEEAELWCMVDGLPLISEHITWRRPGFPFKDRTTIVYKNNTSYLTIKGVTRKDMGPFYCVADNGLGNETSQAAFLVVKRKNKFFSLFTFFSFCLCNFEGEKNLILPR